MEGLYSDSKEKTEKLEKHQIQLNKATLKDTQASSYAITFYGKLTNLIDILGDKKLKDLDFNEYQMAHGINPECFHDMASWLKSKGVL